MQLLAVAAIFPANGRSPVTAPGAAGIRLDIGAGDPANEDAKRAAGLPCRPEGAWTTVDAFQPADIDAAMWDLPLAAGSVDEIWSSHALEHVAAADVAPTLAEWLRVLRPGGLLTLQVPDLDHACRNWLEHPGEAWSLAILFGGQGHPGDFHRTGFSRATLAASLLAAGFGRVAVEAVWDYGQVTLRAQAVRP